MARPLPSLTPGPWAVRTVQSWQGQAFSLRIKGRAVRAVPAVMWPVAAADGPGAQGKQPPQPLTGTNIPFPRAWQSDSSVYPLGEDRHPLYIDGSNLLLLLPIAATIVRDELAQAVSFATSYGQPFFPRGDPPRVRLAKSIGRQFGSSMNQRRSIDDCLAPGLRPEGRQPRHGTA